MKKDNKDKTKKSSTTKIKFLGYRVALPKNPSLNEEYVINIRPPKGLKVSKQHMESVAHSAVYYLMAEGFMPPKDTIKNGQFRVHCRPS